MRNAIYSAEVSSMRGGREAKLPPVLKALAQVGSSNG
jgi:hypothetical protein